MRYFIAMFALLWTQIVVSQEQPREIKREVRVENENGVQTVEIITSQDGKITTERFTGEDATRKLEELSQEGLRLEESTQKKVKLEEIDGKKRLTITTIKNGEVSEEVFTGADIDLKLKELELEGVGSPELRVKEQEKSSQE